MHQPVDPVASRPTWWDATVAHRFIRCRPRLLVVADGLAADPQHRFGLADLLVELSPLTPAPIVTTVVHAGGFRLDAAVDPDRYDEVWVFATPTMSFRADEVRALWAFMERGGGLFVHDGTPTGAPVCRQIPRVRHALGEPGGEWSDRAAAALPVLGGEELPSVAGHQPRVERVGADGVIGIGRHARLAATPPPGQVSVWDGHAVGRGRVVHAATGTRSLTTGAELGGAAPALADWLAPAPRRWCLRWVDLLLARYCSPLASEYVPLPRDGERTWVRQVVLGRIVATTLDDVGGAGTTATLLADVAAELRDVSLSAALFAASGRRATPAARDLGAAILGRAFDALARELPIDPGTLCDHAAVDHDDDAIRRTVVRAAAAAWRSSPLHPVAPAPPARRAGYAASCGR